MSFDPGASGPERKNSRVRRKSAKKGKAWKNKAPEKPAAKPVEVAEPKVKRRPEWLVVREAGAERQAEALVGLDAARETAGYHGIEISVSMIALSRRGKPTVAHVRFTKGGRVFAHYHPAVGRLFYGRKGKIADEGRYETVEEATGRVIAYDAENGGGEFSPSSPRGGA